MVLLFIGPSGSGKDTQAELLEDQFNFNRVSTGDLVREISEGEHKIQQIIRRATNEGFLSDNFIFGLLQMYISHLKSDNIILSGAVRRDTQIELLDFTLFKINKRLDKVIYFDISDDEAVRRMSARMRCPECNASYNMIYNPPTNDHICDVCGATITRRPDDNEEGIRNRLIDFHKDNDEILEEYDKRGLLIKINGERKIEEISEDLIEVLGIEEESGMGIEE